MKKYLVTGGCGFIGLALTKKLIKKSNYVDILDLPQKIKKIKIKSKYIKLIEGDISKKETFKKIKKKYHCVYHLAAQTSTRLSELDPDTDINTNIVGSLNLCNWARIFKPKRVVFTSSMAVYGKIANKIKENSNCSPLSIYGLSKLFAEKIFERLKDEGIKVNIYRLFNAYGPGQDLKNLNQGMFSIYLAQAVKLNKIKITGRLERYRDFVFISDVVDALMLIPKSKKNWIFNIGSGKKIKVRKIIKLILKNLKPKKIKLKITKGFYEDTWGSYANNSLMLTQGWKPKVNIEKGALLTINDALKNKS
jgi:UDP-glucose 4-epimerase|tara:strand:+ start:3071 stop:3991 length:921 start_codon:yes stop_codon:yes gene_type:complete